jgi:folylpolyglutamate synthase
LLQFSEEIFLNHDNPVLLDYWKSVEKLKVQESLVKNWNKIDDNRAKTHVTASIEEANELIETLYDEPADIFVTGSLHLVGGLLVVFDRIDVK